MPGRHVTDHQMRLFMKHRTNAPVRVAAARAGFSTATGHRIAQDPRLPSQKELNLASFQGHHVAKIAKKITVGVEAVDQASPLGRLKGTDNTIVIHSKLPACTRLMTTLARVATNP